MHIMDDSKVDKYGYSAAEFSTFNSYAWKFFQNEQLVLVFNAIGHKYPCKLFDKHLKHYNEEQ